MPFVYVKSIMRFVHFLPAAYALVSVLSFDLRVLSVYGLPLGREFLGELHAIKNKVKYSLILLWLTGIAIVAMGCLTTPDYLDNQKLWFKVCAVLILTVNGYFIHRCCGRFKEGVILSELDAPAALGLNVLGVISSVSWVWACFLGSAREWSFNMAFSDMALLYVLSLCAGGGVSFYLHQRHVRQWS
ncbi:hypothetical protein DTO96_100683 [Ephemeroptericola cinctiostellae]|uniref:Protoporphyrinogen IX oxidase n=1 Tax=Ephemeroptericola cinctiostellae TaxID=2268024 RepID=A0A345D9C8_9BURK|nr:hypothetical protein [Ephemeroptericola cinctiostellae]AXF84966.1 hypothetical protein DTO96_100683 [Ephemeroptericola cinctiostellae]